MDKIQFREFKESKLDGYTLVEGFPGLGLVGTIAVKYLSEKLDFEEVGYLESEYFSPVLRIHNGLPLHPGRIYASKKHKVVLLVAEQIIPRKIMYDLSQKLIEWIRKKKITRVISLAGIRSDEEGEKIYGIAANAKSLAALKKWKVQTIEEGLTTGITALILTELKHAPDIEAFSILANVRQQADYRAAATVIKKLDDLYPSFAIDVKPLEAEAKKTEAMLREQMKEISSKQNELDQSESAAPYYG